jgi:hypothetical protein
MTDIAAFSTSVDATALYALIIIAVLGTLIAVRYSRPHIGLRRLPWADGELRFHLKNFMSMDVRGRLVLVIRCDRAPGAVRVSAGPWLLALGKVNDADEHAFHLSLDGLPADGLVGIAVRTADNAHVDIEVARDSEVVPRGFRSGGLFSLERSSLSTFAHWGLGLAAALAFYWGRFALLETSTWGPLLEHSAHVWDFVATATLILASFVAHRFCTRYSEKSSVEGSIDWGEPSGEWRA